MSVRWERVELERSWARGAWDRWSVQDATLHGGWLWFTFEEQRRIYAPMEHRELPHHFAKIAVDEDALFQFVNQYGRLGWRELMDDEMGMPRLKSDDWHRATVREHERLITEHGGATLNAEPIEWIKAHAQTVGWCLAAAHAVRIENGRSRARRCEELSGEVPRPYGCRGTLGWALQRERVAGQAAAAETVVAGLVEDYLWINLRGVRRRVLHVGRGQFKSVWGGNSLLESMYALVADAVSGGRLAQCQSPDCGAVFLQTDERQRFCPPREGYEKSRCMNRERVRKYRRQLKERSDAKTTRTR